MNLWIFSVVVFVCVGGEHASKNGDDNYCSKSKPCGVGKGDCDRNSDCKRGLVCGKDNCHGNMFGKRDDCCVRKAPKNGDDNYCSKSKPCGARKGDCDRNSDCKRGLVCGKDNCHGKMFDKSDDCCVRKAPKNGDDNYCRKSKPCGAGKGDCDRNSDCKRGLVCGKDNCHGNMFDKRDDCCVRKAFSVNIAKGKPAAQSSTAYGGKPARAVDGNTNSQWGLHSCTFTRKTKGAWWGVDLLDQYYVNKVKITNRGDCCGSRLRNFEVRVGDNKAEPKSNEKCSVVSKALRQGETRTLTCPTYQKGRYVFVVNNVKEYLTLCEVQVFGEKECKKDVLGLSYRGISTTTMYGLTCQAWNQQTPHKHNRTPSKYPKAGLTDNYCRNPDRSSQGPWCYTTSNEKRWQYCDIKICVPTAAPLNVHVLSTSSTSLRITWDPPPQNEIHDEIRKYRIRYGEVDCNSISTNRTWIYATVNGTMRLHEITGLAKWSCYAVQISAVTIRNGSWSDEIQRRTNGDVRHLKILKKPIILTATLKPKRKNQILKTVQKNGRRRAQRRQHPSRRRSSWRW